MPVYEIKANMPLAELIGWLTHFKPERVEDKEPNPMEILKAFGC